MFASYFLKRALPFTLTLVVGAALGGLFNFVNPFGARPTAATRAESVRARNAYAYSYSRRNYARTTPAVTIYEPNTKYTREAWERGITGVVRLRLMIDASGSVTKVETVDGLPYGLTEEARKVAWETKFSPATVNGERVSVTQDVDYIFSLSDRMAAGL